MKTQHIRKHFEEAAQVLQAFMSDEQNIVAISSAADLFVSSLKSGGKIISCGNGGSHCDAMHFAEELTGRYRDNRQPLAAICISDASHISCVGNDYGFNEIFSRYIQALGNNNDCLLAISTSGNSPNIIAAVDAAKAKGMKIIALTGKDGGKLAGMADVEIRAPHSDFADRAQEIHIKVIHALIDSIERGVI